MTEPVTDPDYLRRTADALAAAVRRHEAAVEKAQRDLQAAQDAHGRLRQDAAVAASAADQSEAEQPRIGGAPSGDSVTAYADPATATTED